jgi:hypothetical protein
VTNATAFDEYWPTLKQVACPRCQNTGFLNRHGFLRGYGNHDSQKQVRGWRLFCSNRHRRQGCGLTHSVLLSGLIYRHSIESIFMNSFFSSVTDGSSRSQAWMKTVPRFCVENAYRLWQKLETVHLAIRSRLTALQPPPSVALADPRSQTWAHLQAFFGQEVDGISAYQHTFQCGFFSSG